MSNDMDNLFRQAAEYYPLRTDRQDWDKVLLDLQRTNVPLPPVTTGSNRKPNRNTLWLLLLLLPLTLLYSTLHKRQMGKQVAKTANQVIQSMPVKRDSFSTAEVTAPQAAYSQADEESKRGKPAVTNTTEKSIEGNKKKHGIDWQQSGSVTTSQFHQQRVAVAALQKKNAESSLTNGQVFSIEKNNSTTSGDTQEPTTNGNKLMLDKQPVGERSRIQQENIVADSSNSNIKQEAFSSSETIVNWTADSLDAKTEAESRKPQVRLRSVTREKGVYVGLLAAWDISTVKLQKVNKTGHTYTFLAGYRFSKRLSVESGIAWNNKKYYTSGQYFDKSRTGISPDSKIIYANGSCTMFEIPVAVKYDMALQPKSNLFLTAGLSSYIMKDEKYSYYAEHDEWYYYANKSYRNSGANWLSVANVSIGYQRSIGKHMGLRIEPYAKLPLSGLGIARLPILSTGISAGITRKL